MTRDYDEAYQPGPQGRDKPGCFSTSSILVLLLVAIAVMSIN